MTSIKLLLIGLLLAQAPVQAQQKDLSKDDNKSLTVAQLIQVASSTPADLDDLLDKADFHIGETRRESDFTTYHFINNNTFVVKRFDTKSQVFYTIDTYTSGLKAIYEKEIVSLPLKLKKSDYVDNGIRKIYAEPTGKWLISFTKTFDAVLNKVPMTISVVPV